MNWEFFLRFAEFGSASRGVIAGRVGAGWGLSPGPEAVRDWEKGRDREQNKERGTRQEGNHLRVWGPGAWRLRCPPGRQGQGAGFGDGEAAGGLTAAASKRTSIL